METLIEGKTKLIESLDDKSLVRIRTKDSLTANDAAIQADLPVAQDKTSQTIHVFALLKREGIPVAYRSRNDETSFVADKCRMIPIECVIRRRPYGSYIKREPQASSSDLFDPVKTEFFHKHAIVKGEMISEDKARELYLRNGEWTETVYTDPLIEPHDETWLLYPPKQPRHDMQPLMDIIPVVDPVTLEYIRNSLMIPCFETIEKAWKKVNVDLIDMKIEVGINSNKEIVIADVIDNDSWRIWPHGDPKQQLDKQSFRDGENLTDVQRKYAIVTEYTSKF